MPQPGRPGDEAEARRWLEGIRWRRERRCARCGSDTTDPVPTERPMPYWCGACRKYFSIRTGTVMQSSKVPLRAWVRAIRWMSTSRNGPRGPLYRDLGVTQKTAFLLARAIRETTALPAGKAGNRKRGPGRPRSTTAPLDASAAEIAAAIFKKPGGGAR